jgi:hypothetical protein
MQHTHAIETVDDPEDKACATKARGTYERCKGDSRERKKEREAKRGAGPPPRAIWSDDPMRGPRVKPRLVLRSYITDAVL